MAFRAFAFGRTSNSQQSARTQSTSATSTPLNQSTPASGLSAQPAPDVRKVFNVGTVFDDKSGSQTSIKFVTSTNNQILIYQLDTDPKHAKQGTQANSLLGYTSDRDHVTYKKYLTTKHKDQIPQLALLTPTVLFALGTDCVRTYSYPEMNLLEEFSTGQGMQPYAFRVTTTFTSSTSQLNPIQPLIYIAVAIRKAPMHIYTFLPSPTDSTGLKATPSSTQTLKQQQGQTKYNTLQFRASIPVLQTISTFSWFPIDFTKYPFLCPPHPSSTPPQSDSTIPRSTQSNRGQQMSRFGQPSLFTGDSAQHDDSSDQTDLNGPYYRDTGSETDFVPKSLDDLSFRGHTPTSTSNLSHTGRNSPQPNTPQQGQYSQPLPKSQKTPSNTNDNAYNTPSQNQRHDLDHGTYTPTVAYRDTMNNLQPYNLATLSGANTVYNSNTVSTDASPVTTPRASNAAGFQFPTQRATPPPLMLATASNQLLLIDLDPVRVREININDINFNDFLAQYPQTNRGDALFDAILADKAFAEHYRVGKKIADKDKDKKSKKVSNDLLTDDCDAPVDLYFTREIISVTPFPFGLILVVIGPCCFLYAPNGKPVSLFHHQLSLNHHGGSSGGTAQGDLSGNSDLSPYPNPNQPRLLHQSYPTPDSSPQLHPMQGNNQPLSDLMLSSNTNAGESTTYFNKPLDFTVYELHKPQPFCILPLPMTPRPQPTAVLMHYHHPYIVYATCYSVVVINPYKSHDISLAMTGGGGGGMMGPGGSGPDGNGQSIQRLQEQQLMIHQQQSLFSIYRHLKPVQVLNNKGILSIVASQILPPFIFTPLQTYDEMNQVIAYQAQMQSLALQNSPNAPHPTFPLLHNVPTATTDASNPAPTTSSDVQQYVPALYMYTPTTLRVLAPIPLPTQIKQLQKSHAFNDAKLLCSLSHPNAWPVGGRTEQLYMMSELTLLSAFSEFMDGHYESAIMIFQSSQINPEYVLLLFPFLLPKSFQPSVQLPPYVSPLDKGPHTLLALSALIPYLHYLRGSILRALGGRADTLIIEQDLYSQQFNTSSSPSALQHTSTLSQGSRFAMPSSGSPSDSPLMHSSRGGSPYNQLSQSFFPSPTHNAIPQQIITQEFFTPQNLFSVKQHDPQSDFSKVTIIDNYHGDSGGGGGGVGNDMPLESANDFLGTSGDNLNEYTAPLGDDNDDMYDDDSLSETQFGGSDHISQMLRTSSNLLQSSSGAGNLMNSTSMLGQSSSTSGKSSLQYKHALLLKQQQLQRQQSLQSASNKAQEKQEQKKKELSNILAPFSSYLTPPLLSLIDFTILSAYIFTDPSPVLYFLKETTYSTPHDTIALLATYNLHDEVITYLRTRGLHQYAVQYLLMLIEYDIIPSQSTFFPTSASPSPQLNSPLQNTNYFGSSDGHDNLSLMASGTNINIPTTHTTTSTPFNPLTTFILYCRWLFYYNEPSPGTLGALQQTIVNNLLQQQHHAAQINLQSLHNSTSMRHSQSQSNPQLPPITINPVGKGLTVIEEQLFARIIDATYQLSYLDQTLLARIFIPREQWVKGLQLYTTLLGSGSLGEQRQMITQAQLQSLTQQYDVLYQLDDEYAMKHQPFASDPYINNLVASTGGNGNAVYNLAGKRPNLYSHLLNVPLYNVNYSPTIAKLIVDKLNEQLLAQQRDNELSNRTEFNLSSQSASTRSALAYIAPVHDRSRRGNLGGLDDAMSDGILSQQLTKYAILSFLEYLLGGYTHYQCVPSDISLLPSTAPQNTSSSTQPALVAPNQHTPHLQPILPNVTNNIIYVTKVDQDYHSLAFLHTQLGIYQFTSLNDCFSRVFITDKLTLRQFLSGIPITPPLDQTPQMTNSIAAVTKSTIPSKLQKSAIISSSASSSRNPASQPTAQPNPTQQLNNPHHGTLRQHITTLFQKFSTYLNTSEFYDPLILTNFLFKLLPEHCGVNSMIPMELTNTAQYFQISSSSPSAPLSTTSPYSNKYACIHKSMFLSNSQTGSLPNPMIALTLNENPFHSIFVLESTELFRKLTKHDISLDIFVSLQEFQRAELYCNRVHAELNNRGNLTGMGTLSTENIRGANSASQKDSLQSKQSQPRSLLSSQLHNASGSSQGNAQHGAANNIYAILFQLLLQYSAHFAQEELLKRQKDYEEQQLILQQEREEKARQDELDAKRDYDADDLLGHNSSLYDSQSQTSERSTSTVQTAQRSVTPGQRSANPFAGKSGNMSGVSSRLGGAKIVKGSSVTVQTVPVRVIGQGSGTSTAVGDVIGQIAITNATKQTLLMDIGKNKRNKKSNMGDIDGDFDEDDESGGDYTDSDGEIDDSHPHAGLSRAQRKKLKDGQQLSPFFEAALSLLVSNPNAIDLRVAFDSLFQTTTVLKTNTTGLLNPTSSTTGQALEASAVSLPIATIFPLFSSLFSTLSEHQRSQLVLRELYRKQRLTMRTILTKQEETFLIIDHQKSCACCYKKMSSAAFVVVPIHFLLIHCSTQQQVSIAGSQLITNVSGSSPEEVGSLMKSGKYSHSPDQKVILPQSHGSTGSNNALANIHQQQGTNITATAMVPVSSTTIIAGHPQSSTIPPPITPQQHSNKSANLPQKPATNEVLSAFGVYDEDPDDGFDMFRSSAIHLNPSNLPKQSTISNTQPSLPPNEPVYVVTKTNLFQYTAVKVFLHYICYNQILKQSGNAAGTNDSI